MHALQSPRNIMILIAARIEAYNMHCWATVQHNEEYRITSNNVTFTPLPLKSTLSEILAKLRDVVDYPRLERF